jgi:hypothetical protein
MGDGAALNSTWSRTCVKIMLNPTESGGIRIFGPDLVKEMTRFGLGPKSDPLPNALRVSIARFFVGSITGSAGVSEVGSVKMD